ncbi:MAG: hypothetical protein JWN30_2846 [Bacilli bacterium]|nr:hypothetical protein [Bacilli bacterium]
MTSRLATLPDALVTLGGERITTSDQWVQTRRPEIVQLFLESVYGKEPVQRPDSLTFSTEAKAAMKGAATCKKVDITFKGPGGVGTIHLLIYFPTQVLKPVPLFLLMDIRGSEKADPEQNTSSESWPAEIIVSKGYAAAIFQVSDLDPDNDDGFQNGVHGIFDSTAEPRPANAWATMSAWAWGASRVMDYLETDSDIDAKRVAVVGHSRGGKAALWAGAADERFAMVVSNNSGCSGAALARGKIGEKLANINTRFPHWFNGNYKQYNDKEDELPIDQHMLLGLVAPRLLYVTSASEDSWADPESEFLSVMLAEPIFHLFEAQGLGVQQFPQPDSPLHGDKIGYHLRTGKHNLVSYDWERFIEFADRNMR